MSESNHTIKQAAAPHPPGPAAATATVNAPINQRLGITGSSSSATPLTGSSGVTAGRFVTMQARSTTVYVVFGAAGVGAATTNDCPIADGQEKSWQLPDNGEITHFRAIGDGTGHLHWYISSR